MSTFPTVLEANHIADYRLGLTFTDGTRGEIDFHDDVVGRGGVFEPLEDAGYFAQVRVVEGGTISWPNGVEFAPEVLYRDIVRLARAT